MAVGLAACSQPVSAPNGEPTPGAKLELAKSADQMSVEEVAIREIDLEGPLAKKAAEISGLAWYEDQLIILPQFPTFSEDGSFLYMLSKSEIEAYLDGESAKPLLPAPIKFIAPDYAKIIDGFEGFEAIAIDGEDVFLTIEADTNEGMRGYLVKGKIMPDLSEIVVETTMPAEILPQVNLDSQTYEALLVAGDELMAIYEANGAGLNLNPQVFRFNKNLQEKEPLPFPPIAYRITDATDLDENGRFWVTNYNSGSKKFYTDNDPIAESFGLGKTHELYKHGERLVELQLTDSGVVLSGSAPIQLELPNEDARKWEGLARLGDRGFLVATDRSPDSILGFVEH